MEKVNALAYKLQLPSSSMVHPVFHVSQLKLVVGGATEVSTHIPNHIHMVHLPVAVLDKRVYRRQGRLIRQVIGAMGTLVCFLIHLGRQG